MARALLVEGGGTGIEGFEATTGRPVDDRLPGGSRTGDPGLLTRRGASLLAEADVVLYDRLVHHSVLALAPASAELIDVGKRPDGGEGRARPGRTRSIGS